jgi:hypothetical protein
MHSSGSCNITYRKNREGLFHHIDAISDDSSCGLLILWVNISMTVQIQKDVQYIILSMMEYSNGDERMEITMRRAVATGLALIFASVILFVCVLCAVLAWVWNWVMDELL